MCEEVSLQQKCMVCIALKNEAAEFMEHLERTATKQKEDHPHQQDVWNKQFRGCRHYESVVK